MQRLEGDFIGILRLRSAALRMTEWLSLPWQSHRDLMIATKRIQQSANPFGETSHIRDQVLTETGKGDLRRCHHKQDAQEHKIHQINEDERKKCSVIAQISLVFWNHPAGEGKVERPGNAENGIEELTVWRDVHEQARDPIGHNREQAIERKKIRSQRDQEICPVGDDMAAIAADSKFTDASPHQPNPEDVRHLVAEDVNDDRSRQTNERDQPKDDAEREKPKFRARPQALMNCCPGKSSEECLGQDRAPWQQKNCDDIFDPARRHGQRHRVMREMPRHRRDIAHDPHA
jgi:hypothetical protein